MNNNMMCSPRATQLITTNRPQFAVMNKSICQDRLRTQQEVNAGRFLRLGCTLFQLFLCLSRACLGKMIAVLV